MISVSNVQTDIFRTERGLTLAGTRITLYQFMDYICAGYSLKSFRYHFSQITDKQFDTAMSYIEVNRAEVETEYQIVLKEAEESRQYWEEQNREKMNRRKRE